MPGGEIRRTRCWGLSLSHKLMSGGLCLRATLIRVGALLAVRAEACLGKALASSQVSPGGTDTLGAWCPPHLFSHSYLPLALHSVCQGDMDGVCQPWWCQHFSHLVALFQMDKWVFWQTQCPWTTLSPAQDTHMKVVNQPRVFSRWSHVGWGGVGWSLQVPVKRTTALPPHGSANQDTSVNYRRWWARGQAQ